MQIKEQLPVYDSEANFSDSSSECGFGNSRRKINNLSTSQQKSEASLKYQTNLLLKDVLSRNLFLGEYVEKRFVESLYTYRDIIEIDHQETEIIKCLKSIQRIHSGSLYSKKWLGITNDGFNDNFYLWVQLENLPLGRYWFKIQSLTITDKEVILQVKSVRPFGSPEGAFNHSLPSFDFNEIMTKATIWRLLQFGFILIFTIITCLLNSLPMIGDMVLRLLREISYLIRSITPLILGIFDLFAKCVGGFYWMLIMMMKRPQRMPMPDYNMPRQSIQW